MRKVPTLPMSEEKKLHKNRKARVFAFQFLYHFQWENFFDDAAHLQESLEKNETAALDKELREFKESVPAPFEDELYNFSLQLIKGVLLKGPQIETDIESKSDNWKISRMSKIDLTLLKLGIYEMEYENSTPPKVVVNEILELAKEFSTEKSAKFVNGILDELCRSLINDSSR